MKGVIKFIGALFLSAIGMSAALASDQPPKKPVLKLDEYSLNFKDSKNDSAAPGAPSGLSNRTREDIKQLVGFSLTRPLSK